jgi:hypothetical protein
MADMPRKIKDTGKTQRRVNPEIIAKALGAEDTGVELDTRKGTISLLTLRQFLLGKLSSTGGRPRLRGTRKTRSKISFFDEDWEKIELLSKYYREEEGINVTSSQIASALIHAELSKIDASKIKLKSHSL